MEQAARRRALKCFTAFVVETIFPCRACAHKMFLRYSSDLLGFENEVVVPLSFQTQDCSAEKYFRERVGLPGEGAEIPPLSRIGCLTAVLPLEPALEVALLGLNFFLSQRIVITGSVEVDDVTGVRALQHRMIRTQSAILYRRELHVTVIARFV